MGCIYGEGGERVMIEMLRNIRLIAAEDAKRMIPTVILSIMDSLFNSAMYCIMILILLELVQQKLNGGNLKLYSIALVLIFTIRCIVQSCAYTKAQYDGPIISKKLRLSIGNHIRSLNLGFFNQNSQGKLNATLTTDISDFETILTHCLCDLVKIVTFTIFSLFLAIVIDWKFGLLITLIVIFALPLLNISGKKSSNNSKAIHLANQNVVSRLIEYISGIKTFRLYNTTLQLFHKKISYRTF